MVQFIFSPFWRAAFFLSGMIIGVGMYGIPYVISLAGFFLGTIELFVLTAVILLVHLMYGEIVLRTKEWHRLPGYARIYLGSWAQRLILASWLVAMPGALGAYALLGGEFLSNLFGGAPELWSYRFLAVGAIVLFFGLRFHAKIDMATVLLLIVLIAGLFIFSSPYITLANFPESDLSQWFLPYGIIMFALAGMAAIPDMVGILEHHPKLLRRAIIVGTCIPAVLYFFFTIAVVGVTGAHTSEEAIRGVAGVVGPWAGILGSAIGVLSTFGAFIAMGSVFKSMLHLDMKFGWKMSWFIAVFLPFLYILLRFDGYLMLIGFLGSVFIAIDGLIMLLIYEKAISLGRRNSEYSLHVPAFIVSLLAIVFIGGFLYEIMF